MLNKVALFLLVLSYSLHGSQTASKSASELSYPEVSNDLYNLLEPKDFTQQKAEQLKAFLLSGRKKNCEATFRHFPHKSILMHAAAHNPDALRIIARCFASMDRRDENGDTGMHYAVKKGSLDACRFLYIDGARFDIPNNAGVTARQLVEHLFEQYTKAFTQNTVSHSLECTVYTPCSAHQFQWSEIKEKKEFFTRHIKQPIPVKAQPKQIDIAIGYDCSKFFEMDIR